MTTQHPIPSRKQTDTARKPRQDATFPERLLWSILRNPKLDGLKFRRQCPIDTLVADFHCDEAKLAVQLDGMSHVGQGQCDDARQAVFERLGIRVLRFTNDEVLQDIEAVAEAILREADARRAGVPSPQPSPRGRGGGA